MFPGSRFGGPAFVQFGRDNEDAVDEYVYAISGEQWDNGNNFNLGRVHKDHIPERDRWEFALPNEDGSCSWTKNINQCAPVLSVTRHLGAPEMVYIKSLKKYLLATWGFHTDFQPNDGAELTILESDHPWGPFSLVHDEWMWYKQEAGLYCPRIYYMPMLRGFKLILDEQELNRRKKE